MLGVWRHKLGDVVVRFSVLMFLPRCGCVFCDFCRCLIVPCGWLGCGLSYELIFLRLANTENAGRRAADLGWQTVYSCGATYTLCFFLRYMKPLCHIFDVDVLSAFAQKCKNMLTEKTCGKYRIPNSCNMEILSLWRSYIFLRMPRITNRVTNHFQHDFSASCPTCFIAQLGTLGILLWCGMR